MDLDPLLLEILACPCPRHEPRRARPRGVDDRVHVLPHDVPGPRRHPRDAARRRHARTARRGRAGRGARSGMTLPLDEALLDDPEALAAADSRNTLIALASAGAQVREAATLAARGRRRPGGRGRAPARCRGVGARRLRRGRRPADRARRPGRARARPGRAHQDAPGLGRPGRPRRRRVAVRAGRGPARRRRRGGPPRLPAAHRRRRRLAAGRRDGPGPRRARAHRAGPAVLAVEHLGAARCRCSWPPTRSTSSTSREAGIDDAGAVLDDVAERVPSVVGDLRQPGQDPGRRPGRLDPPRPRRGRRSRERPPPAPPPSSPAALGTRPSTGRCPTTPRPSSRPSTVRSPAASTTSSPTRSTTRPPRRRGCGCCSCATTRSTPRPPGHRRRARHRDRERRPGRRAGRDGHPPAGADRGPGRA